MKSRQDMVRDIREKYKLDSPVVLAAILKVPREKFVAKENRKIAHEDGPISIGYGQTISQPYTVAFMTDLLNLDGTQKVLEIGTGSGYQTAILSLLARKVYSVERIGDLATKASKILKKLGYNNVRVKKVKTEVGWQEEAPFDAILVTAGLTNGTSTKLLDQLKVGGIMVAPIGKGDDKTMTRFTKDKNKVKKEEYGVFHFVPFIEK